LREPLLVRAFERVHGFEEFDESSLVQRSLVHVTSDYRWMCRPPWRNDSPRRSLLSRGEGAYRVRTVTQRLRFGPAVLVRDE
jgi:hypothetical protein